MLGAPTRSRRANVPAVPPEERARAGQLAEDLGIAIGRLVRRLRRHGAGTGLGRPLVSALSTVDIEGEICPSELAELEGVARASITPVIAALETRGLIKRKAHPHDGRQFFVAMTRRGRSTLARERAIKYAWLAERVDQLSPADRAALEAALPALRQLAT